jgi:PilZ domain
MAEDGGERRGFGRGMLNMAVVVTTPDGRTLAGGCRDLSLDGVFVVAESRPPEGTLCQVAMTHSDGRRTVAIEAKGVVARHTPGGFGVRFTAVGAEDLRRIYHLLTVHSLAV